MPVNPVLWGENMAVSANKLNTDLYNYIPGNLYTPTGILFHTQRPILAEFVNDATGEVAYNTASTWTAWTPITVNSPFDNAVWCNYWDSAAYYGPGADEGSLAATGQFTPCVLGQDGQPGEVTLAGDGYYTVMAQISVSPVKTTYGSNGVGIALSGSPTPVSYMLSNQLASSAKDSSAYGLDIVQAPTGTSVGEGFVTGCSVGVTTGSGSQTHISGGTDWTGEQSKLQTWWTCISTDAGTAVPIGPAPPVQFTGLSEITSEELNSSIYGTLNFLNYPPVLRAASANSTSIAASTITTVPLTSTSGLRLDTYAGLSGSVYTVPVSGVYLVHGAVAFTASANNFNMLAGVKVNSTDVWGPAYQIPGTGTSLTAGIPQVTTLLDLEAGDTVTLVCYHNSTASQTLSNSSLTPCRLVLQWLGGLGTPFSLWDVPDPGYRWAAGTPGAQLPGLFNEHIANDLGFLVNRPYLLAYQSTAQTGIDQNSDQPITMQTNAGRIHASEGDNYSGWSGNQYTAQRAGWYLVVGNYIIKEAGQVINIVAQAYAPGAGSQVSSVYWGQHVASDSGSLSPGATFCGLIYLASGDIIEPYCDVQLTSGTTYSTTVNNTTGQTSDFGLIWMGT